MAAKQRIKILRPTVCGGKPVKVGDIVTATEKDARTLLAMGKAVPAEMQTKETPAGGKGKGSDKDKPGGDVG